MVFQLILILGLMFLSGFFSSTETALFSFNRTQLLQFQKLKNPRLRLVAHLMERPNQVLVSLLVGNNMVNIMLVLTMNGFLAPYFAQIEMLHQYYWMKFIAEVGAITVLLLIVGEIAPKSMALRYPRQIAYLFVTPFNWFHTLTGILKIRVFLTFSVSFVMNLVEKVFGKKDEDAGHSDIQYAVESAHKSGNLSFEEASVLNKVLALKKYDVSDLMIDKSQVYQVESSFTLQKAIHQAVQHDVSKCPVYDKKTDSIVGVFDLVKSIHHKKTQLVADVMDKPHFVPQLQGAEKLTEYFIQNKPFYFVVLDEFGQYRGIVNSDGFLEELTRSAVKTSTGELPTGVGLSQIGYKVKGDVKIEVLGSILGTKFDEGDSQTVGGLIMEALGRIPQEKEWVVIEGWKIYIEKSEPNRIVEVQILKRRVI